MRPDSSTARDIATAMSIGSQLCQAFGLDPSKVVKLELTVERATVARLVVTSHFSSGQSMAACEFLTQRFDLVERDSRAVESVIPAGSEAGAA